MKNLKAYYKETVINELVKKFKYKNKLEAPKIEKIILARGLGSELTNAKSLDVSLDTFRSIRGQKPATTRAKKSISNFKLREGQIVGCLVTLRGQKMYDFLTKFLNLALPKIRDFQGISARCFDGRGNYTLGIKEEIIFPEVNYDKLDKIRGLHITFVTSAKTDKESYELLKLFGMPFKKEVIKKISE